MNRYRAGGPSNATATTLCQKCLKKGHYSYECTASQNDRPYTSRPSRTQQLLNPKLAPKLSAAVPEPKPEVKRLKAGEEDSRTRESRRRSRSVSTHSSDSVSTISTNRSESPDRRDGPRHRRESDTSHRNDRDPPRRRSPSPRRKQPRESLDSTTDRSVRPVRDSPPKRPSSTSARRQSRRSRSRSPYRGDTVREPDRSSTMREDSRFRERSLSPYSRRMAMTRAAAHST